MTNPTMTQTEFHAFFQSLLDEAEKVMHAKAADYAQEQDAFRNFHTRAEQLGLTREQVWAVFAMKHVDALLAYCREGKVESEPLRSRCIDVINYVGFLAGFDQTRWNELADMTGGREHWMHQMTVGDAGEPLVGTLSDVGKN
jgi:hypothetical protein